MFSEAEVVDAAGSAAMLTAIAWTGALAASRLLPDATAALRLATTWLVTAALAVGIFMGLAAVAQFRFPALVAVASAVALTAHVVLGRRAVPIIVDDGLRLASLWQSLGWWRAALLASASPSLLRLARGAVAPPLAWDAITYHLPRAAQWIRSASFSPLDGPDASAYYNHFPPYGEVLLAWGLAAFHSDAALFLVGAWVWAGIWIGGYALARTLGADRMPSLAAAAACACTPAVASLVSASYVDNAMLAMLLCGLALTFHTLGTWRAGAAVGSGLAIGLMLGTKSSGVPVAAALAAASLLALYRSPARAHVRAVLLAALVTFAVAAPPFVLDYAATGNPFYPVGISARPLLEWRGDALFEETHREGTMSAVTVLEKLFSPYRESDGYDQLGFGPAAIVLAFLAVVGLVKTRCARMPHVLLGLACVALAVTVPTFLPSMRAIWSLWAPVSPRLVTGAVGIVAAVAACSGALATLWTVALVNAALSVPHGIGPSEWSALREGAPWLLVAAATAAVWLRTRVAVLWRVAALAAIWTSVVPILAPVRAKHRTSIYAEAAAQLAFDVHTLSRDPAGAWPLWHRLDGLAGTRLAIAGGFVGAGHTWYRYPLYGSRLQHDVTYVPVSADGSLVSYRTPDFATRACEPCWTSRLYRRSIALVVGLYPHPLEVEWARGSPARFPPLADTGTAAAFVVEPDPTFVRRAGR